MVEQIASLLNIGLDKESLSIAMRLLENGINPVTLAHGILDLQREGSRIAANSAASHNIEPLLFKNNSDF